LDERDPEKEERRKKIFERKEELVSRCPTALKYPHGRWKRKRKRGILHAMFGLARSWGKTSLKKGREGIRPAISGLEMPIRIRHAT